MTTIRRIDDQTGRIRYTLDDGGPQLLGSWYDTREEAEHALQVQAPPAKTRTITLTDRPPVHIKEDEWPIIASASDKVFDNQYEFQANVVSRWNLGVRQHRDGRAIVYATYSYSSNYQNARDYHARAGMLLTADATQGNGLVDAIRTVSTTIAGIEHADSSDADRWRTLRDECIADLPAVAL